MIKRRMVAAVVGMLLSGASSLAAAETTGFYFGVTGGQAQVDVSQGALDDTVQDAFFMAGAPVTSGSSDLDDEDISWSLFGGYRLSPYLALEVSYIELGTAEYRASGTVDPFGPTPPTGANYSLDFEVSGITVAGMFEAPVGQMFQVRGQAGVLFATMDIDQGLSVNGSVFRDSYSSESQDFFFGVGGGMNLGEQWSFNLDWQRFKDVGDTEDTGEANIDRIALGVIYRL